MARKSSFQAVLITGMSYPDDYHNFEGLAGEHTTWKVGTRVCNLLLHTIQQYMEENIIMRIHLGGLSRFFKTTTLRIRKRWTICRNGVRCCRVV